MTLPRVGWAAVLLVFVVQLGGDRADAEPLGAGDPGYVAVIEVSGLLDRVLVDFIDAEITALEARVAKTAPSRGC